MYDGLTWGDWLDALYIKSHFIFQNEVWAIFCLLLFVSICIRLNRIEKKIEKINGPKKRIKHKTRRGKFDFRPKM